MTSKLNYALMSFIFASIISILTYGATLSSSTVVFSCFVLILGNFFTFFICNKKNKILGLILFNTIFSIYTILAVNHFLNYSSDLSIFNQDWRDEYKFFIISENNQYLSVTQNFINSFINNLYPEYNLYVFYISLLASLAHSYFDGNHLLLQFLGTSIFGVLTSVMVFKILCLYVEEKKAFYYALAFMLLSVFNFYSYNLIRDISIAFFYTWGIYLVLSQDEKRNIFNLSLLLIINWLVFELRLEHGLLFSLMTLYYCFNFFKRNKVILVIFSLIAIAVITAIFLTYVETLVSSFDNYAEFTNEAVQSNQDSIGQYVYNFPPVIRQISIIIVSQILPFPSWGLVSSAQNVYQFIYGLFQVIYTFFWFIIFYSLSKWIIFERKIEIFKKEILALTFICLLFLFANTANMTLRRIIAFYPFIYLLYVLIKERSISHVQFQRTTLIGLFLYLFLVVIYLVLKL